MLIRSNRKKFPVQSVAPFYAAAGSTPFSLSWITPIGSNTTAGTSFTFTSQNLGTADATRIIAIGVAHGGTSGITVSGVTVGGNAATQAPGAVQNETSGMHSDIWYYADAGALGTSANIVVTASSSQGRCAIAVYRVVGTGVAFSSANGAVQLNGTSQGAAVTVPAGGGTMAVLNIHASAAAGTVTNGGNLTIDSNGVAFGSETIGAGSNTAASGSTTFTMNWTGTSQATLSVATFSP
jgi:hypothetical protein